MMPVRLQISEEMASPVEPEIILRAAEVALEMSGKAVSPETELTVVLTDDEQLHRLNLQFLGIDAPTDVLSFPADFLDPDTQAPYLGDVLISIPRLLAQAAEVGHSATDEIRLLTIHGVLHLLGYDHAKEVDRNRMWTLQDEILDCLSGS